MHTHIINETSKTDTVSFDEFFKSYNQIYFAHTNLLNLKFKSNKPKWESLKFIGKWAAPSKYCEYHLKSESQIPNQFELFKLHQHLINLNNTVDQER